MHLVNTERFLAMSRRRIRNETLSTKGLSSICHPRIHALGHRGSHIVYVADHNALQWAVDPNSGLRMFAIEDVFLDRNSVLLGCGIPNVYTAICENGGDGHRPGWRKFAAYMFCREDAQNVHTSGRIQGGVIYELRNLPEAARQAIRHNMAKYTGKSSVSCAYLNTLMLSAAGFTLGNGRSLRSIVRPTKMASLIWRFGLLYNGQPVDLRVVVTGEGGVGDHFVDVWHKEVLSSCRLVAKKCGSTERARPPRFEARQVSELDASRWSSTPVDVAMSRPSWFGVKAAFIFGQHPVYSVEIGKLPDELQASMRPYSGRLSLASRAKKATIMSPDNVGSLRRTRYAGEDVYFGLPAKAVLEMLTPSQGPEHATAMIYNCVVTMDKAGNGTIRITSLKNGDPRSKKSRIARFLNWYMAKHLLIAGYKARVAYACELWTYDDPTYGTVLCINRESGTYKPLPDRMQTFARFISQKFGVTVKIVDK